MLLLLLVLLRLRLRLLLLLLPRTHAVNSAAMDTAVIHEDAAAVRSSHRRELGSAPLKDDSLPQAQQDGHHYVCNARCNARAGISCMKEKMASYANQGGKASCVNRVDLRERA